MQDSPKDLRKKILGRQGEDLAAGYLRKQGYKILERNFKTPFGEADIIACKDGVCCFVEVKRRSTERFGLPAEAVDFRKQERYRKIAQYWCCMRKEEIPCRFDVISILGDQLEHFENAFM